MTDFRYIGPPYNLGECQEQSFSTTVSCDACIDPFNVDKPPTPIGQAPGKDMALIDIARMGALGLPSHHRRPPTKGV